jgi:DNA-directed RNA polymerase specialized sigma24 family protein
MKSKELKTKYIYYRWKEETKKEVPITITVGDDGVTEEHILLLEEFDHDEQLQERYTEENLDYATENKKMRFARGDENIPEDPMNAIATNSTNPETLFDEEEVMDSQVEQLLQLMEKLTPAQIDLIYDHYGARRYLADIAKQEDCSPQAVANRKNKIITRLKKLFSELDKQ